MVVYMQRAKGNVRTVQCTQCNGEQCMRIATAAVRDDYPSHIGKPAGQSSNSNSQLLDWRITLRIDRTHAIWPGDV